MERAARSASAIVERGFICRLCMGNFEYCVNIFYSSEVYNIPVWTLMVYLLHVKVSKDDGLPDTVCRRCLRKLLEFKEFKEQCMKSETELRKSAKERDFFCPVKEEELGNSGRALESIDAAYTTGNDAQVTSVSTVTQGPLAMDNMCPVKEEEERVMEVVAEEGIKREDDVLEGLDSGLTAASNMDPVVVDSIVDNCHYVGGIPAVENSEKHSLALHIKGHVYREASEIVMSENEFPGGMSSNPLVRNGRNIEKEIFEASEKSSMQMNSKSKYEKPTFETLVIFEEIGREVNHSNALLAETVTSLDKVGFVCDACGMAFQKKGNLVKHINIHIGLSAHKCSVCGKKFKLNSRLKKHEAIHSDVKRFEYDLHGSELSKKFCLRKNEKAHTVLKPFKCDECGKNFKSSAELKRHSVVHTGEKPFKCEFCGKMFGRSWNLKTHLCIHTGEKPFKCDFCGKIFSQSGNLKQHLSIHTGEKPYKCAVCGKMFSQKSNLVTHLHIHTGVRPFMCHFCGKGFAVKSSLKRHLPIHTGVKQHKCDKCGKEYKSKGGFKGHLLTHADL